MLNECVCVCLGGRSGEARGGVGECVAVTRLSEVLNDLQVILT